MNFSERPVFIPYSWGKVVATAGLTSAEALVLLWAGTQFYRLRGRWVSDWNTRTLVSLSGRDRQVIWRARNKLLAAGLVEPLAPTLRSYGQGKVFDVSKLVEYK
jgi:hypothetical protein